MSFIRCAVVSSLAVAALCAAASAGSELYRSPLESGAGWVTTADADTSVMFGYDYSLDGLPEAPNSRMGDLSTRGVRMRANLVQIPEAAEITLSPTGQSFSGSYRLRFDAWTNYDANERINGSSAGTTEFIGGGVGLGAAETLPLNGYSMLATNDGGSGSDWRVFTDGAFLNGTDMPAGSRNGSDPYYTDFLPGVAPPMAQAQDAFPEGVAGSPGFQWLTFEIFVTQDDKVLFTIERPDQSRLRIAQLLTADFPGVGTDGNIGIYYADLFSSVSSRPDLAFGVIDNVIVETPAPGATALFGVGVLALSRRRRA